MRCLGLVIAAVGVFGFVGAPLQPTISVLPITFDGNFSESDTAPLANSLRHSLKANLTALPVDNGPFIVTNVAAADYKAALTKANLTTVKAPFSSTNLAKMSTALGGGLLLQVRITNFTIKAEPGKSKPTYTASASAMYWLAPMSNRPLKSGSQVAADGTKISASVPATTILMDKPTMHKLCGTLMKQLVTDLKAPLNLK